MAAKPLLTGAPPTPPIVVIPTTTVLDEHETSSIIRATIIANHQSGVVRTMIDTDLVQEGGIIHLLIIAMSAINLLLPPAGGIADTNRVVDTAARGDNLMKDMIGIVPVNTQIRQLQAVGNMNSTALVSAKAHRDVYMTAMSLMILPCGEMITSKIAVPTATLTFHVELAR